MTQQEGHKEGTRKQLQVGVTFFCEIKASKGSLKSDKCNTVARLAMLKCCPVKTRTCCSFQQCVSTRQSVR